MQKRGGNVSLNTYADIFSTEQSRVEDKLEKVREILLAELHPFKNHPFKVLDDESMQRTVESIARFGVLSPAIARPCPDGGYELVEVKSGKGSKAGWGRLKSGAGWISLDYCRRV